ncbi:hypothetical protein Halxa_0037 (plasmid) [Halopiger xanaduensis SH-6]|uniref:Uncharacterized protein n=1 Tax=Halopiger xanaduensis (strain DSM 18323 / JCM 14033 / SH-6) TaxID=797210 RepID=F8DEK3_HALXS|nr:hypothetical protein Halxa_0037 [Halopiger xanaduensis SH-6]
MILEIQQIQHHHIVLEVDTELCNTVVSACKLRSEWFTKSGDETVGDRLETIATIWMAGRHHGYVTTRVAWLELAADACDWYTRVLRPSSEDELAQRATDACRQLRSVVQEYRLRSKSNIGFLET